ncbi:MAG: tRNA preQ1(34) S-adenosylmethionine ribosyltransferase-isomerase QueA [Acidimicrobiales bacterium]
MQLSDLDYDLPEAAIAQVPIEPRDAARLLVDRGPGAVPAHHGVRDLPDLLEPGDLLVVNDTRVLPARLRLQRASGGAVEVLLLEALDDTARRWEALVRPGRKLREGEEIRSGDLIVRVGPRRSDGTRAVELCTDDPWGALARHGEVPLPPYLTQGIADPERYQTVYARRPASAAAPTAGLHLTAEVLDRLAARGVGLARVELVVGIDTFRPVTEDDPTTHRMHTESYAVPAETMEACRRARRVVAVGTTSARALESAAARQELVGRTDLFIHPPYDWKVVDLLLTNFHLPRTTLLLMIGALVGPRWRRLYETALAERYRFLSFGDAMLLQRGVGP